MLCDATRGPRGGRRLGIRLRYCLLNSVSYITLLYGCLSLLDLTPRSLGLDGRVDSSLTSVTHRVATYAVTGTLSGSPRSATYTL